MNENFFGLRSLPFEDRADTKYFYATPRRDEILAAVEYEIHQGPGFGILIGRAGTGKTLLLRTLLPRLQKPDQAVVLTCPANGGTNLVRECCKRFGVSFPSSNNEMRLLNRLRRLLSRSADKGFRSVLMVDQAENFSPSNIAQLATLADLYGDRGKLLTLILAAQPAVRSLLDRPEFTRIRRKRIGEHLLSPLTPAETAEYIRHRLRIAGAGNAPLFEDQAISRIHAVSDGIPRLINRVCRAAMLAAHDAQSPRITRAIVEEAAAHSAVRKRTAAARDLGLVMTGEVAAPWMNAGQTIESGERLTPSEPRRVWGGHSMTPGTPDSSMTRPDILWDEEAEEAWASADGNSGASIVDGVDQGSNVESFGPGPNIGTFLLARLERATARAQRLTGAAEATLARLAAVENQLAAACESCQSVTRKLDSMILSAVRIHDALQGVVSRADEKVDRIEAHHAAAGHRLNRLRPANVTGRQVLEPNEESRGLQEVSVAQTHPTKTTRRFSRAVEPFLRSAAEADGGELQVLSEPRVQAAPNEPKPPKPPARAEDIAQLIEEAMR